MAEVHANARTCMSAGKTLIARQIGKMLNGKEPKIVNGPEILNKYVGASEENVRNLFKVRMQCLLASTPAVLVCFAFDHDVTSRATIQQQ